MSANLNDMEQLESSLGDLEDSLDKIKDEMTRTQFESQILLLKLKHERLRAMAVVTKSRSILANMEWMLAKTELGLQVKNLENSPCRQSTPAKKKKSAKNDDCSSKKVKLSPVKKAVKQKTTRRSSRSNKENVNNTLPKTQTSKTQEQVLEPQVLNDTNNSSSMSPESLPCTMPLQNITNSVIWPTYTKKTIFLNNPPVRDTKVNKNIGYYSTEYAKQMLGYNPDALPEVHTLGNSTDCNGFAANCFGSSDNNISQTQVSPAYNLSVGPGYNLNVLPGYVIQHKAQVHRTVDDVLNTKVKSPNSSCPTSKATIETGEDVNHNNTITNQLFRDLMSNKNNAKDDEIRSMATIETLVIKRNIDAGLLSPVY